MYKKRRTLIKTGLGAVATLTFGSSLFSACNSKTNNEGQQKLEILILGGTSFLGPAQIAYALGRGHAISTFTRGKTKPTVHKELFKRVESLIGDRANNLHALRNRKWDVVIDNSGHNVEWTKASAELLKDNVGLYVYTSSTGVYYPYLGSGMDENTKVLLEEPAMLENEEDERIEYWYGVMKSNSELAARTAFGDDRTLVIRPTYMIGPGDKSDRFIHWPVRLPRCGDVLVPGKSSDAVQFVDVRDVAGWMIRMIEKKIAGTYNAVGPQSKMNMYTFVEKAVEALNVDVNPVYVNDYEFLKNHKVHYIVPWIMPVGNNKGSALIDNTKAVANGLTFRDIKETVVDVHAWWNSAALTQERRDEFEKKKDTVLFREQEILKAWKYLT